MSTITIKQRHAWIVEMRTGLLVDLIEYQTWIHARARAVTRVATHVMGSPYRYSTNVNKHEDKHLALVPKQSPSPEGAQNTNWDPDGVDLYAFKYKHPQDATYCDLNGQPFVAGGVPSLYDGEHMHEAGFHYTPWIGLLAQIAGGNLEAAGLYQYTAIYEWIDARGYKHRSSPALIRSVTLDPGNQRCTVDVACLSLSEKHDRENEEWSVRILLFRTEDSGDTFYFEQAALNNFDAPYVTFTSQIADADIITKEILYTDGGVKPDFQPPAIAHVVHHESRLWTISKDDPHLIWISKIIQPGYNMPGFPLEFVIKSDVGGRHVALASIGTQLIAIKEEGIYAYAGDAPNDLGEGGTLRGPVPIARHTGCVNPKSVVTTPQGVAFQGRESIWMIDRGMQINRIGAPVEDLIAANSTCRKAVLDQRRELIYFLMHPPNAPSQTIVLCYHYMINEWTWWQVTGATRSLDICNRPSVSRHELTTATSRLVQYLGDGYVDSTGQYPVLTVSTPWLQFAGLAGFQKVQRAQLRGRHIGRHTLVVRAYYDFDDTTFDEWTWTPAELDALITGQEMHIDVHLKRQKCKAIRIQARASAASPESGGLVRWETIVFKIGGKKGVFALPLVNQK